MRHFRDRLELLIERRFGGKWTHLAREAALSHGSVNNYLKGTANPGYRQISQICEASGANANWLILGEGPMFRGEAGEHGPPSGSGEGCKKDNSWWQDLARTLQLRINDLEREVEAIRFAKTGPIDQDSAFWAVFQSLSKEDRRELRDLVFGMAKRREEESETMVLGKTSTPQEDQS